MKSRYYCALSNKCLDYPEGCHNCRNRHLKKHYFKSRWDVINVIRILKGKINIMRLNFEKLHAVLLTKDN